MSGYILTCPLDASKNERRQFFMDLGLKRKLPIQQQFSDSLSELKQIETRRAELLHDLNDHLREIRQQAHLSQEKAAHVVGLTTRHFARCERGEPNSHLNAARLEKLLVQAQIQTAGSNGNGRPATRRTKTPPALRHS